MLLRATHLTFGKIATLWAKENADKPSGLNRDKILDELKKALRQGEFDFATLTIDMAPRDVLVDSSPGGPPSYVRIGPSRLVVIPYILDKMLFQCPDEGTRKTWLEGLRISRDAFGRWCEEKQHEQPTFWPQKNDAPKSRTTIAAQTRCKNWLVSLMRVGPPTKNKGNYRKTAQREFEVGTKVFDRAWANAVAESGNNKWMRPGPKSVRIPN